MDLFTYALAKGGQGSGGTGVTVDSVLSDQSTNPVQNKVLKAALDMKADTADVPTDTAQLTNGAGFATPQELLTYAKKTDLNNYPTKDEQTAALAEKADASTVNAALALKANTADVTAAIAAAIGSVSSFEYYLCGNGEYDPQTGEPTVQDPDTEHIYLVPTSGSNLNMYAYINSSFTFLGTTEVDLSGYAQTADLADVATSGSYADLDDTPDIPKDTADLTNSAGYITNPRTAALEIATNKSSPLDKMSGLIGGADAYLQSTNPTQDTVNAFIAAVTSESTVYLNNNTISLQKHNSQNVKMMGCNFKPTETTPAPATGLDIDDPTKPAYGAVLSEEDTDTGWVLILVSTEPFTDDGWKLFFEGSYLTEHQSLAAYAKTADVNAALAAYASKTYVDAAVTGKQDTLTFDNSPTANSNNPVKSGGVYTALQGKQDTLTFDTEPMIGSPRPVKSGGIYTALQAKADKANLAAVATSGSYNDLSNKPAIPTVPEKLVTGSAKAYTVVVSDTAPAAGTADSVITIVV